MRAAPVMAVALALLGPAAAPASEAARVVARDAQGRPVAALRLAMDGRFALAYRHSREESAAQERYVADPSGPGFRLVAIASRDAGVLDYYELEGRRTELRGLRVLTLAEPVRFASGMDLAASALGRRTLVTGTRSAKLHPPRGTNHLRIAVEGS